MSLKNYILPHYNKRIDDLRDFRNRYSSIISRVRDKNGRVEVELPEAPEDDLEKLNHDMKSRLLSEDDGHFVPSEKREELLVEMEAIEDYADDRIKVLKKYELIAFTIVATFTLILLFNILNIPLH